MSAVTDCRAMAHERYLATMIEVKRRLRAVIRILGAKKPRTVGEETDNEFMWLQVRKVLELVAFAGVSRDDARYARLRGDDPDPSQRGRRWRVDEVLSFVANTMHHFLPIPISSVHVMDDGRWSFDAEREQQILERFFEIYDRSTEHLHAPHPFGQEPLVRHLQLLAASRAQLVEDIDFLVGILWTHVRVVSEPRQEAGEPPGAGRAMAAWLVRFGPPDVDDVQMVLAEGVDRLGRAQEPSSDS